MTSLSEPDGVPVTNPNDGKYELPSKDLKVTVLRKYNELQKIHRNNSMKWQ